MVDMGDVVSWLMSLSTVQSVRAEDLRMVDMGDVVSRLMSSTVAHGQTHSGHQ